MVVKTDKYKNMEKPNESSIAWKEHNDFFKHFYELKLNFQKQYAEALTNKNNLLPTFQALQALIMMTTAQINTKVDIKKTRDKEQQIAEFIKFNKTASALNALRLFHDELSIYWSETEILPKVNEKIEDKNAKFWRDEDTAAIREMKKAFYDMLIFDNE